MDEKPNSSRKRRRRRGRDLSAKREPSPARDLPIRECFGPDRRRIRTLARKGNLNEAKALAAESINRIAERKRSIPEINYPNELPFTEFTDEIKRTIVAHQVVVVSGETGSGKSTQLPKLLLDMGRGTTGLIGHTQPRRLAARAVADRVAEELGTKLGDIVGYKVRFGDHTNEKTLVKLMTDGILLAETRSDRLLEQYDTLIIDEAHERSLNIDFLLGYIHQILKKRPDLKVVITSATIDAERFAAHFESVTRSPVPILEISGRTYPVEIRYRPVEEAETSDEATIPRAVVRGIEELAQLDRAGDPGDVLVFLPGEREIREVARELRHESERNPVIRGSEILPLYARLSPGDQQRIFRRTSRRRIVLSTNVAETSLTVPGIRYVIDSGQARMNRYSSRRKIQTLQIEPISRASARQRAGRCGRTEPGVCIRLYSETDHDSRDEYTTPEILRTNLSGVILQMHSLRLGEPQDFPFVEPPDARRINDAYDTLHELGAIDESRKLTQIGHTLARLPVDPRIGRILVHAGEENALRDALVIASFLEVRDPRERPFDRRDAADQLHARFRDPASDFVSVLRLWDHYHALKDELSRSQLRKRCEKEMLSYVRLREWTDTHRQLRDISREAGLRAGKPAESHDGLHRAILTGSLTGVGKKHPDGGYSGSRGGRFSIHPSSGVKEKGTNWLVSTELVRTTKLYARTVARIDPSWIEAVAGHLLVREYAEPTYIPERGRVEARATVTLYELDISKDRLVDYGSVNREHARMIFIEQALVDGEYETDAKFRTHNDELLRTFMRNEAKLRRTAQPDRERMIRFFNDRLPEDVMTAKRFDRWRRKAEQEQPKLLFMTPADLGLKDEPAPDASEYPDEVSLAHGPRVPLQYKHDPGGSSDGVSIRVPVQVAAGLDPDQVNWFVPGWMTARVETVLRGLPREVRRQIDIAETRDLVADAMNPSGGPFFVQLARLITDATSITVTPEMCRAVPLPEHLHPLIAVEDEKRKLLWESRNASETVAIARKLAPNRSGRAAAGAQAFRDWPDDDLLAQIESTSSLRYPALVDTGNAAELRTFDDLQTSLYHHYFGVRRLAHLALETDVRKVLRHTPGIDRARLSWATVKGGPKIDTQIAGMTSEYGTSLSDVRTEVVFRRAVANARSQLAARVNDVVQALAATGNLAQQTQLALGRIEGQAALPMKRDITFQLSQLVHAGTLTSLPVARLKQLPRYLEAIRIRMEGARGHAITRDAEKMGLVQPHWSRCIDRARALHELGLHDPQLEIYRWLIEEFRVHLFAQRLGTSVRITESVLNEQWGRTRSL